MELFKKSFLRQKEEEINIIRKRTLIELVSDVIKASAILFVLIYIAQRTITGVLTIGQMAMFLLAFRQGMACIKDLFSSVGALYEDGLFIGDTFEFLNLREMMEAKLPVVIPSDLRDGISVRDLSFTYPGNSYPTLDNISFEIKKGEIIALVGPNGAGKSTLVKILTRLYDPDTGVLKYDGNDIRHMDPVLYRRHFSVVFQDFMLYNLRAGENIRMGNIDMADAAEKIRNAAVEAGVDDLINNLPSGYDTLIGTLFDESRELSWGEWQKIALARALFRESSVLILDEPSSSLDSETEYEIFSRFRDIVKGRTSILITHRLVNVKLADRVLVLDKGKIAESGTHDELLRRKGLYFSMFTKQSILFEL